MSIKRKEKKHVRELLGQKQAEADLLAAYYYCRANQLDPLEGPYTLWETQRLDQSFLSNPR